MATRSRETGESPIQYNIERLSGGTGGAGGKGRHGGQGGPGEGPVFYAGAMHMHVEHMYGHSTMLGSSPEAHLLQWFASKALFNADAAAGGPARRACTDNTRVGLISRLKEWACDNTPESSSIFWLSGMAGTGKSTVAYTLCQNWRAERCLGASFFCSRNDEKARSRTFIIPTIVRQLLPISRQFARSVGTVDIDIVIPESDCHVEALLVQPWLSAIGSQSEEQLLTQPLVVVIDALDEIEGNDQGPELIRQLIQAVSASEMGLRGLKFFVTSRPHPRIMEECSSIDRKAVYHMEEIAPQEAFEDVRRFVNTELSGLPRERQEDIVTNSAGFFIYAATVVRYLSPPSFPLSPAQQQERLDRLMTTGLVAVASDGEHELPIHSLYKTILTQALPNVGREVETSKRVLYAVVTTRRPLTVSDLAPLAADATKNADEMAVRNSLDSFHAVLYVSPRDKCIYTFHKSFSDFILDPGRLPELSNVATSYFPDRTRDCLRILDKFLCFNICNLASSFLLDKDDKGLSERVNINIGPELRYACQYWASHLASVRHDRQEDVQRLSALLLDFCSLKVLFWMEAMNLLKWNCYPALELVRTWALPVQNGELNVYMAAGQRLWASFVQGQASQSTPHLYVSSLATELALTATVHLMNWRKHFPWLPSIECRGITRRGMLMTLQGHSGFVLSVAFSPDGARVVSGSADETVRIWDATTGPELTKMEGHSRSVLSVAFSPDGARVVSGSADKTVRIWDATTGAELTKMEGHSDFVFSVAFSPDGARIVSGSADKTVRIWDATTGAELTKMEGHSEWVQSVAFSPDGARVVSGSADKAMLIWDATTGPELTKMEGHSDFVFSVAFSPDGARVVSGSADKTVRIWDATTGAEVTKMEGHSGWVHSVAFSPDGARIVSGLDVTVRISRLSDWICTMDGWVVLHGHPQFRLFWYPPELRDTVLVPPCLCRISEIGQTRLKFRTRFLGTNWQQVHHSPHFSFDAPASGNPASVSAFSERHWTIVDPKNATEQAVQDDLALRRLMLDEKAQLIEMLRLDVLTKDKFKAQLAQIEARYEATTRPSPAKRARLASSSDVGSSREVGNISLF